MLSGNLVVVSFYIKGIITKLNGTNNYGIITGLPSAIQKKAGTYNFGQIPFSIGVMYNIVALDNPNMIYDAGSNIIRLQRGAGQGANKLQLTSSGGNYFEIGGSACYILG